MKKKPKKTIKDKKTKEILSQYERELKKIHIFANNKINVLFERTVKKLHSRARERIK